MKKKIFKWNSFFSLQFLADSIGTAQNRPFGKHRISCLMSKEKIRSNIYFLKESTECYRESQGIHVSNLAFISQGNYQWALMQLVGNISIHTCSFRKGRSLVAQWFASNHRLSHLWVQVPEVLILRSCPNMILAVERNVKPHLWLYVFDEIWIDIAHKIYLNDGDLVGFSSLFTIVFSWTTHKLLKANRSFGIWQKSIGAQKLRQATHVVTYTWGWTWLGSF